MQSIKEQFHLQVLSLQKKIVDEMKKIDASLVVADDSWTRVDAQGAPGGGGLTIALNGQVFENAGVNTSLVYGAISPEFSQKLGLKMAHIWATGISLIIHPFNPRVPTVHANFRLLQSEDQWWFGGGADLTPFYPHEEDFRYFHHVWKRASEKYGCYEVFKKNCDEYFVNHHRQNEMRGIGGLFFDHYNSGDEIKDLAMVTDLSNHFIESYFPIVKKRILEPWTMEDEDFQQHRRGRYVEFNLLHDRGTHFGLKTNGRTDSILISLPRRCKFTYLYQPKPDSAHERMMKYYYPHNWID